MGIWRCYKHLQNQRFTSHLSIYPVGFSLAFTTCTVYNTLLVKSFAENLVLKKQNDKQSKLANICLTFVKSQVTKPPTEQCSNPFDEPWTIKSWLTNYLVVSTQWKILVKLEIFLKWGGEIKNIWNHHLDPDLKTGSLCRFTTFPNWIVCNLSQILITTPTKNPVIIPIA